MAQPVERADGTVVGHRHPISAVILLVMAAFATWNVLHNSNWAEVVLPFGPQFRPDVLEALVVAVACWAGGLGLLTASPVGLRLGWLGAAVLFALGGWFLWNTLANPTTSILFGTATQLAGAALSLLLMAPGIALMLDFRLGPRRRAPVRRPTGPGG